MNARPKKIAKGKNAHLAWLRWGAVLVLLAGTAYLLFHAIKKHPPSRPESPPPPAGAGLIAIIIDDNGYSEDSCRELRAIPQPLTIAILPHLPYSRFIADCAHANRKEIMLHLPMEPRVWHESYAAGYVITTDMTPQKIKTLIDVALESVPYAHGVNNHMGSKATENKALMKLVLNELQQRGLYFIDSRVTLNSAAPGLARIMRMPFAERDVFLDNEADRNYIIGQMRDLAREARDKGHAIGIGHARPLTWSVIRQQAPILEGQGFRFVTADKLLQSIPIP